LTSMYKAPPRVRPTVALVHEPETKSRAKLNKKVGAKGKGEDSGESQQVFEKLGNEYTSNGGPLKHLREGRGQKKRGQELKEKRKNVAC